MTTFLVVLHVIVSIFLIAVVLLQRGKGAEIGAVFGGGASSTVFGSRGAGNFLTKLTTASAVIFMGTSLSLSYIWTSQSTDRLFDEDPAALGEGLPLPRSPTGVGVRQPFVDGHGPSLVRIEREKRLQADEVSDRRRHVRDAVVHEVGPGPVAPPDTKVLGGIFDERRSVGRLVAARIGTGAGNTHTGCSEFVDIKTTGPDL